MKILTAVAIALLGAFGSLAQAGIISTMTGGGSITAGGNANFVATISGTGPPSGYDGEYITGISYTFQSGDGQSAIGNITGLYNTSYSLSQLFTYATSGNYTALFNALVTTNDPYHYYYTQYYWVNSGYQNCNWYTCWWNDTSHWEYYTNVYYSSNNLQYSTNSQTGVDVAAVTVTAVPEPATLSLFALGLLGLGAARRRNQLAK